LSITLADYAGEMSYRTVPDGWVELTANFIDEVRLGIHAGWRHFDGEGFGETVFYAPPDGTPQAWQVKRDRVLGQPMPVIEHGVDT
jgi:hypothetical protein